MISVGDLILVHRIGLWVPFYEFVCFFCHLDPGEGQVVAFGTGIASVCFLREVQGASVASVVEEGPVLLFGNGFAVGKLPAPPEGAAVGGPFGVIIPADVKGPAVIRQGGVGIFKIKVPGIEVYRLEPELAVEAPPHQLFVDLFFVCVGEGRRVVGLVRVFLWVADEDGVVL